MKTALFRQAGMGPAIGLAMMFLFPSTSAEQAEQSEHPQGVWGSEAACAAWQAGEPTTPATATYRITEQWLERYLFACYFGDSPPWQTNDGHWQLSMICGEDGVRPYTVTLVPGEEGHLSLVWQHQDDDFEYQVGPLMNCDGQY